MPRVRERSRWFEPRLIHWGVEPTSRGRSQRRDTGRGSDIEYVCVCTAVVADDGSQHSPAPDRDEDADDVALPPVRRQGPEGSARRRLEPRSHRQCAVRKWTWHHAWLSRTATEATMLTIHAARAGCAHRSCSLTFCAAQQLKGCWQMGGIACRVTRCCVLVPAGCR